MKAKPLTDNDGVLGGHVVFCPGCRIGHLFDLRWTFNRDFERPTFTPSMLVNAELSKRYPDAKRCHSYVTDGRIQFLDDCDHDLKGQTVDLPDLEAEDW